MHSTHRLTQVIHNSIMLFAKFEIAVTQDHQGPLCNTSRLNCYSFVYIFQGFTLEDATGLAIKGDVDVHSVYATSLPRTHPSFSPQQVLEMTDKWRARPLLKGPSQLFIGILSATNHFAERMAIRKTWMQYPAIQLGHAVARFFVALVRLSIACLDSLF